MLSGTYRVRAPAKQHLGTITLTSPLDLLAISDNHCGKERAIGADVSRDVAAWRDAQVEAIEDGCVAWNAGIRRSTLFAGAPATAIAMVRRDRRRDRSAATLAVGVVR